MRRNPWMTQGILKSISKKKKLFEKFKGLKLKGKDTIETYSQYKTYNDMINKLVKRCKKDYFYQYFKKHSKNSKQMWTGINRLQRRSSKSHGITHLEEGNTIVSDSLKINKFNSYFLNVADNLGSKIPKVDKRFLDYLPKKTNTPKFHVQDATPDEIM